MAHEPLLRRLREADEALESAWRQGGRAVDASAKETLLLMERTMRELRAALATLPAEQRARASEQCEVYERKLVNHRAALQAAAQESSRGQLLNADAGGDGVRRRKQQPGSREEGQQQELCKLSEARDQLRNEFERMKGIGSDLEEHSGKLRMTQDQYHMYDSKLAYASQRLGQLKKKMDEDSRYIWWSFYFFLSVAAYIFLKRLKVFKMMYLGGSLAVWSGSSAFSLVQGFFLRLASLYDGLCELLGIPSVLDTASQAT